MREYTAEVIEADKAQFTECDARTLVAQIGRGNLMAISGSRVLDAGTGVILPVSSGYKVTVNLAAGDTYTVRRVLVRGLKAWIKGERTGVHCEEVGDAAYYASCFRSYGEDEWVQK